MNPYSVKSRSVTTPPDPNDVDPSARPAYSDAYLAISGTWPASGVPLGSIGIWTSLGGGSWAAIAPAIGQVLMIEDEGGGEGSFVHYAGDAGWIDGMGSNAVATGTVPPSALIWDGRVQNQTTTTPPSTWSKGIAYIAAPSSTGDWAGFDGSVMVALTDGVLANGDTFTRLVPYDGMTVYDINLRYDVRWDADNSSWKKYAGNFRRLPPTAYASAGAANWSKPDNCIGVEVFGLGGGGGGASNTGGGNNGADTTFGSHVTFHGGEGGGYGNGGGAGGDGGTGSGDYNFQGGDGSSGAGGGAGGDSYGEYGSLSWPVHAYGKGGNGGGSPSGGGGGAGAAGRKWIEGSDLADIEVVTVGAGGSAAGGSATDGNTGYLIIFPYVTN